MTILCSHIWLYIPRALLPSGVQNKTLYVFLNLPNHWSSHPPSFDHNNYVSWTLQISKLLRLAFFWSRLYFLCLRSLYSLQHPPNDINPKIKTTNQSSYNLNTHPIYFECHLSWRGDVIKSNSTMSWSLLTEVTVYWVWRLLGQYFAISDLDPNRVQDTEGQFKNSIPKITLNIKSGDRQVMLMARLRLRRKSLGPTILKE
jgi:hypothetical protein